MSTYIEYSVTLTDGQNTKLASTIKNNSPLTLRLKHSHLQGPDELMLTSRQINKRRKSLRDGTGTDIKISKTQIRHSVKHGGSLFSSLASLGAKVLPHAIRGVSKVAPALATGAASTLGEIGLKKLFGKGMPNIPIPKRFFPMLPPLVREFTKAQIDQINKVYKTGGRLVIKTTRKQLEGGFLGTLASIGIPMAIRLVSKMFGSGLQVDRGSSSNTSNVYVPPPPPSTHGEGYPYHSPPFFGTWENPIGMGVKKKVQRKGATTRKKQPIQLNSHTRRHFVINPLSNFDLMYWVKKLSIKHLRGIYSRDGLPNKIRKACGIINLDDSGAPYS